MENGHGEAKSAARQGLAIVGFVAIAIVGMAIAVYAARFVPGAISGLAGAGAYISDIFVPGPADDSAKPAAPATPETPAPAPEVPATTTPVSTPPAGNPVATTTPTYTKPAPVYYGSPDLLATVNAVGYCTSPAGSSFVPSPVVPQGAFAGVSFTVSNLGTNVSGGWQFRMDTPTKPSYAYTSAFQRSLAPGESLQTTVCFNAYRTANTGTLTITADSGNAVYESNEGNNVASRPLSIIGDGSGASSGTGANNDDLWCDLTASDTRIDEGDTTTLRWETEGADDARINQGIGSVDEDGGSKRVSPDEDTTYRMTVENDGGDTETCSVTIRVD